VPTEAEIGEELAALMPESAVAAVEVHPYAYRTSHWLAELSVAFVDGGSERLIMKDLGPGSLTPEARHAKPALLLEPQREIEVYRDVLAGAGLGTAAFRGAVVRPDDERYWLFLERLEGVELYQVGSREIWCDAAAQLARLHRDLAAVRTPSLLSWNASYAAMWIERAVRYSGDLRVGRLRLRYAELVDRLAGLQRGFLHGELYASNVLVDLERRRFSPVDWETATVGPQLLDLAALTSGAWAEADRTAIALAYRDELGSGSNVDAFLADLDACRLYLAVQWLGWSQDWVPPSANAYDWAADVEVLGERLGLL
jgi:hypothetical protein